MTKSLLLIRESEKALAPSTVVAWRRAEVTATRPAMGRPVGIFIATVWLLLMWDEGFVRGGGGYKAVEILSEEPRSEYGGRGRERENNEKSRGLGSSFYCFFITLREEDC